MPWPFSFLSGAFSLIGQNGLIGQKGGFSLPAVFCFMSQVSKLAVRESDSSRSLRGAKPVRVSLACGVMGETGTLTLQISLQSFSYGIPRYSER